MPELYEGRKLKIRKAFARKNEKEEDKKYLEVTIPAILEGNVVSEGDLVTPYFDGIILYVPEGKVVDREKLSEALKGAITDR